MSGLIRNDSGKNGIDVNLTKSKSLELIEVPLGNTNEEDKTNHFKEKTTDNQNNAYQHTDAKAKDERDNDDEDDNGLTPIAFYSLFRYSSFSDRVLIALGCISATISGATNPVIIILLGWMLESFVKLDNLEDTRCVIDNLNDTLTTTPFDKQGFMDDFVQKCLTFSFAMIGISGSQFILSFVIVFTLSWAAENQALRIRKEFMSAVLRQDVGWYDTHETGDFASRVTSDLIRIQDGIGEKVGICIYFYSTMLISIIVAMFYGWQLTLVILSIMPILMASSTLIAKIQAKISGNELSAYGKAGAIAEEVLSSIRTVASFNGEKKEIDRYGKELMSAKKNGIKRGLLTSIGMAIVWFCIYASYALAFWYGSKMVLESRCTEDEYHSSDLIIVFFCVLTGAMFVGQTAPYMEAFSMAKGAASQIYSIISRVPPIDSSSESGSKPNDFVGHVKFVNVKFRYPSREDVQILQGLNLTAIPGETVALVGSSGCGKSTVIQLLQRFYDVEEGQILVGNRNIKDYNVGFLRDNIGVVGQEPILFATSIYENIRYGYPKGKEDDVIRAAKTANAHDFISKLPDGYNTQVGERGTQLSGGQKQRIAIARALIRNPKILLLDEATSALDTESESVVQAALDEARKGRTTLIVAHRLSTIRNADKIVAVEKGRVKEVGTHEELINAKGIYYQLVEAQTTKKLVDEDDETDDEFDLEEEVEKKWAKLRSRHTSITSTVSSKSGDSVTQPSMPLPPHLHRQSSGYKINKDELTNTMKRRKTSPAEVEEEEEEEEEIKEDPPKSRLFKLMAPEWHYTAVGCFSAFVMGLSIPIYGIIFGDILESLNKPIEEAQKETHIYCLVFLGMGVASGIAIFLQTFMFTIAGESLTTRLREQLFKTIITQEIAFFDDPKNGTGALCSRLASDAAHVQGATGSRIATILQAASTLATAIVIGLVYNYKIGLVVLAFVPLVLLATYFESKVVSGQLINEKKAFEDATSIAVEAIENIRTVASLHLEKTFFHNYATALLKPHKGSHKKSYTRGISFGISQMMPNLAYAVAMYYGSVLISRDELTYGELFKVTEGVILGTMMIGMAVAVAPDYQRAKVSAIRIFRLLDRQSDIDPFSEEGLKPQGQIKGEVEFRNVHFRYPTRKNIQVLRGINFNISAGETVALVGSSGCGKSTCIQLLQRFYNSEKGETFVDDTNILELNLGWLRSQMGIVSQEPVLFGYSIAENIAYGDNSRSVGMDEIIDAAKKANIHNFVRNLPLGYDTNVGDRGTQLSGGQKQRIAIARALVRNPQILLLDEATSALDTESEKVVQEALDNASEGRTCLVIAHRLSTIQNADKILVIHKGRVVEQGSHYELLAQEGFYNKLHSLQSGDTNDQF